MQGWLTWSRVRQEPTTLTLLLMWRPSESVSVVCHFLVLLGDSAQDCQVFLQENQTFPRKKVSCHLTAILGVEFSTNLLPGFPYLRWELRKAPSCSVCSPHWCPCLVPPASAESHLYPLTNQHLSSLGCSGTRMLCVRVPKQSTGLHI